MVLQNLARLESLSWRGSDISSDTALLAGCIDAIPTLERTRAELLQAADLIVGEEYAAGFRDGFNSSLPTRRSTRRYIEGLDDGNLVGYAVRHISKA